MEEEGAAYEEGPRHRHEGVAAPESANNAGAQTSFIPMLALGIPSNVVMALMIGALIIQGVLPGPGVINTNPTLFWGLMVSMWLGNAMQLIRPAILISGGDAGVFVTRPLSMTLLALAAVVLVAIMLPTIRQRRDTVFAEEA